MPRRKERYPEKPHVMKPEIRRRFEAFMAPVPKRRNLRPTPSAPKGGWMLFRWDNLEDSDQGSKKL